jgi:hypothetical protein
MKAMKTLLVATVAAGLLLAGATLSAQSEIKTKPKPYPLKTCVVSGEKFGGSMGEPYVFNHEGREIKLCCKACLKDFNKEPAKHVKKLEQAEKSGKSGCPAAKGKGHANCGH